jgi:hypothetical protein
MNTKKIKLATIKKFIRENDTKLLIKVLSVFDGMQDMVDTVEDTFNKTIYTELSPDNTLNIANCWLVGQSRDYYKNYDDEYRRGYIISNCCGSFILAVNYKNEL